MSHKKRATTALKSMGAAGLAAATIVSGLSFGVTPASAESARGATQQRADTNAVSLGEVSMVWKSGSSWYTIAYDANRVPKPMAYSSEAAANNASNHRYELRITDSGMVQFGAGGSDCAADTYRETYKTNVLNIERCATSNSTFEVTSDGKIRNVDTGRFVGPTVSYESFSTGRYYALGMGSGYQFPGIKERVEAAAARALAAEVSKVNNIAKSAVVSGTATPGAKVSIGSQEVEADKTTGAWSITVTGLKDGENELTAVQTIDGTKHDEKTVTATIVEGGTVVATDAGPIELERGGETDVPFIVQNNETRSDMVGTVTLDAPEGTTFAEGQTTAAASYRSGESGEWKTYGKLDLRDGVRSEDGKQMTFSFDTDGGNMVSGEQYRYILKVTTPEDAPAGSNGMDFVYAGDSTKGDFKAEGKTTTTIETAAEDLVAKVDVVNNIAKTAVVSGTATPGAMVSIGSQEVEADKETGAWTITVPDLKVGANELTVVQTIGGTKHDETKVTATIVDGGTLVGVDQGPVTVERGERTQVPFVVENREERTGTKATVTLTAPENTTFDGQTTVQGSWRAVGATNWSGSSSIPLTNGKVSNDGKTLTFDVDWNNDRPVNQQYRYLINVTADEDAPAGSGAMEFTMPGTSSKGDFKAEGKTTTSIETAGPAVPSAEGFFDADVEAWAGIRGKGAANATIVVTNAAGDQIATTTANGSGDYTVRIDPSKVGFGEQKLTVAQTVNEATSDGIDVTLDYGQNDPKFTSPTEGGSLPNKDFTLTGTGNTGGKIRVNGVDLRNDDEASIGSADVTDGEWSVTNTDVTLPNGPYQFWANQRTKGGKIVFTGLNVTMEQAKPATPSADGYFPEDIAKWAGIRGRGTVGATVTAKNAAGDTIAEMRIVNADGTYNMAIDPSKVGDGVQTLTVTQTVNGAASDGINVALDYGFNTPTFTSPAESSVVPNRNLTLTGTGNTGGRLQVNGVDLGNDDAARIGETTVTNNAWTITNNEITLPTGFYQLWANQRTKGGKISFTGLNVQTVQAAPAAPTAVAFFGPTVETWGAISGIGEVGAEIIVRNADGDVIVRETITDPRGTYNVGIDPNKVGWGEQEFTVTQTVGGVPSKGIVVSLDYGQQSTPTITSPTFGQQIPGTSQLEFTGTGTDGSKIVVTGTDFSNDSAFGDTTVTDGTWSVTSTLDLPAGNYQFWVGERTQGGKNVLTTVDVTITD